MPDVKMYDPQEPVTITLTRREWDKVLTSLQNDADRNYAFMTNWLGVCNDKEFGQQTAARYEQAYKELDALHAAIEKIVMEPWTPKPAPAEE